MEKLTDNIERNFDTLDSFEDEVDCALIDDDKFNDALEDAKQYNSTIEEEILNGEEEIVDTDINYDDNIPSPDMVDIDADDYIAAERDIAFDPFEDDEIIDAAIGENPEANIVLEEE